MTVYINYITSLLTQQYEFANFEEKHLYAFEKLKFTVNTYLSLNEMSK